jgi:hypothetical protein
MQRQKLQKAFSRFSADAMAVACGKPFCKEPAYPVGPLFTCGFLQILPGKILRALVSGKKDLT